MIQGFLFCFWMHKCSKQQPNLQLLSTEKLTLVNEKPTKLAVDDPTWAIESTALMR